MIIVTSGHVDHGKTALLQALTGTHTAHLPEEKKRGLTIDLGYAYLPVEAGKVLGFIDVPGHQKFLSNMLAGLGGIQQAMLIVSAEEGVKPQTVEHLVILQWLGIAIMVVITKADRAEEAQIHALIEQLKTDFPALQSSPFFVTSAQTGQGIAELKQHLIQLLDASPIDKPFRYAIDRVFHIKGAGLVVTGTAVAGRVKVGDELFLSHGERVRVRAIHAQNQPSEQGQAGQRLALNLMNVEKEAIRRGDWLTELSPDYASDRFTVQLRLSEQTSALKEQQSVHLYHFASHQTAKMLRLPPVEAVKNAPFFAEILLDEPLHLAVGDKLILRNADDSQTLCSAEVLEIHSPKRNKRHPLRLAYLNALANAENGLQRIAIQLQHNALEVEALCWAEQLSVEQLEALNAERQGKWLFSEAFKQAQQAALLEKLAEFHQQHQDQLGVSKARLHRMALLNQPEALVAIWLSDLIAQGKLAQTRGWLHLPSHKIAFNEQEEALWQQALPLFAATNQALWVRDVANELSVDETEMRNLLYKAGKLGYLVPIVKDRFLLAEQIAAFAQLIKQFIQTHGDISVNQLRDEIDYGRKLTVQLIEYFDRSGFLRRKGNVHLLRDQESF